MSGKLRCKRIEAGEYDMYDATGTKVGHAVLTGRYGADDYPWDWSAYRRDGSYINGGSASTLRDARGSVADTLRRVLNP